MLARVYTVFSITCLLISCLVVQLSAQVNDTPPSTPNLQTAPAGSYVIAMDNSLQKTTANVFNLKAYGFIVFLLDNSIKIQWVINSGKAKDGIDFSVTAEKLYPSVTAPANYDFKAGPFIIFPSDSNDVGAILNIYNNFLPDSCKVSMYRTTSSVNVDVRYTLSRPPKIALVGDSCDIHRGFLKMASVPDFNYACLARPEFVIRDCYTIVTEPHTNTVNAVDQDSVRNFLMRGGNFLAQCEGLHTYEGNDMFQTVSGSLTGQTGGNQNNNFRNYPNPDMAYAQFEGAFRPNLRGAFRHWTNNSSTQNNWYPVIQCKKNSNDAWQHAATVSKMTSDTGSLVFYLGNHEFWTPTCHTCTTSPTTATDWEEELNGTRVYLNAVLIPSKFLSCVNITPAPLPLQILNFTINIKDNKKVQLQWRSSVEQPAWFIIERSADGRNFTSIKRIDATGEAMYLYTDEPGITGKVYYRLHYENNSGKIIYSATKTVYFHRNKKDLYIYPNPADNSTTIILSGELNEEVKFEVMDMSGRKIKSFIVHKGQTNTELKLVTFINGNYFINGITSSGQIITGKILVNHQ